MLALKLTLVAAVVLLASVAARRYGHGVAGVLSGTPLIAGPIMGFVLLQQPQEHARAIALGTIACLPAMVAHAATFAHAARRLPWYAALVLANIAFVGTGWTLAHAALPAWAACALAAAAPALGLHIMPTGALGRSSVHIPSLELALRVAGAVALAAVIVLGAPWLPTAISGLLLAAPITGNVLPCFTLPRHGAQATILLMRGFVRGMFGFVALFTVLYATLPALGAAVAYALGWLAALAMALIVRAAFRVRPSSSSTSPSPGP